MKKRYMPGRYVYDMLDGGKYVGKIVNDPDIRPIDCPQIAIAIERGGIFHVARVNFDLFYISKRCRSANLADLKPKPVTVRLGCMTRDDLDARERLAALDALAKRGEYWKIYPHFQDVEFEGYYAMVGDVRPGTAPRNFLDLPAAIDWIIQKATE